MMRVLSVIFYIFGAVHSYQISTKEYLVGGTRAFSGEFPYQVSIRLKDRHRCGGALITQRHVLTAAHCLVNYLPGGKFADKLDQVTVVTRAVNLLLRGDRYKVQAVYPHEDYDKDLVTNDIGIMQLTKDVTLSKYVDIGKLPHMTIIEPNTTLTMIGFGTYYTGDPVENRHPVSLFLRKVDIESISLEDCQDLWGKNAVIRETNICTSTDNDIGSCVGDSGGPIIYDGTIQGIVSYGESHCAYGTPDVHTNVALYLDWIEDILKKLKNEDSKQVETPKEKESVKNEPTTKEFSTTVEAVTEVDPVTVGEDSQTDSSTIEE